VGPKAMGIQKDRVGISGPSGH